jgi:translation initiation factor 3 subunit I
MTGESLAVIAHKGPLHGVAWAEGDRMFATISDPFGMDVPAIVSIYDFNAENPSGTSKVPRIEIIDRDNLRTKATRVGWLPLNEGLLVAYESGLMRIYDPHTGVMQQEWKAHEASVSSFSFNATKTLLITTSHDRSAKLWDVKEMRVIQTFTADVPLNSASISPITEHVIVGGGQEAMSVTTTAASAGKFETRFFHMIFGQELGRVKGHFGPINTLSFHPDGRSFTSGAEDGYLRLHVLDGDYLALGDEDDLGDPTLERSLADGTYEELEAEEIAAAAKEAAAAQAVKAAT